MKVYEIYFSPTGGTKKVADILAKGMEREIVVVDLIQQSQSLNSISFSKEDVCILAVPSYGGRVPTVIWDSFKEVNGNGAKVVLVAVYGNRAIDDTLMELKEIVIKANFSVIAGIEAVAEHSLMHQFANGRPDISDEQELKDFAKQIFDSCDKEKSELWLPGNTNYKEYNGVPLKPKTNRNCVQCGLCAKECPVQAIPKENPRLTNTDMCISCMHCVSICPKEARGYSKLLTMIASLAMKKHCTKRKENKLYI